jgi:hypothetical protein
VQVHDDRGTLREGKKNALPAAMHRELLEQLSEEQKVEGGIFEKNLPAHDGRKNLYTSQVRSHMCTHESVQCLVRKDATVPRAGEILCVRPADGAAYVFSRCRSRATPRRRRCSSRAAPSRSS